MIDKQQLDAELKAILKHLPDWRLDPAYGKDTWRAVLIDGTGKGIHVNATREKGRLCLSGIWPVDSEHQQHRPKECKRITIARDRPPEKIAADIQRRFLPWYVNAYTEQVEEVNRQNARRKQQQEVAAELAALLGQTAWRADRDPNEIFAHGLTVQVHHGGEDVSIELRYTNIKVAKAVLRAFVKAGGLTG
jgi:hypothetical protein